MIAETPSQPDTDQALALHQVAAHLQLLLAVRRQARIEARAERLTPSTRVA